MAIFSPFAFGILGNIISIMVYLSPAPTFYRIVKKKSTEGFQSVPYVVALFSATIWIYYASLKLDATLLISINSFGCVVETIYIAIYFAYAPKKAMVLTLKLVILLNFVGLFSIIGLTHYLLKGSTRVQALGWICLVLSVSVFAAPLSIMTKVIRTKSVEFMPFGLSFFLALSAVMWFFYGLLTKDFFVALPNILGFLFGILQMVLYAIYKNTTPKEQKLPITKPTTAEMTTPICTLPKCQEDHHCIQIEVFPVCASPRCDAETRAMNPINVQSMQSEVFPVCASPRCDAEIRGMNITDPINVDSIQTGHCEKSMDGVTSCNRVMISV